MIRERVRRSRLRVAEACPPSASARRFRSTGSRLHSSLTTCTYEAFDLLSFVNSNKHVTTTHTPLLRLPENDPPTSDLVRCPFR